MDRSMIGLGLGTGLVLWLVSPLTRMPPFIRNMLHVESDGGFLVMWLVLAVAFGYVAVRRQRQSLNEFSFTMANVAITTIVVMLLAARCGIWS